VHEQQKQLATHAVDALIFIFGGQAKNGFDTRALGNFPRCASSGVPASYENPEFLHSAR